MIKIRCISAGRKAKNFTLGCIYTVADIKFKNRTSGTIKTVNDKGATNFSGFYFTKGNRGKDVFMCGCLFRLIVTADIEGETC